VRLSRGPDHTVPASRQARANSTRQDGEVEPSMAPAMPRQEHPKVIDRIRHDIQQRLGLVALDPRQRSTPARTPARSQPTATTPTALKKTPMRTPKRAAGATSGAGLSSRTAPGQTKATVLAALAGDRVLIAGEVAAVTGLARPTVGSTLSRLSKAATSSRPTAATTCRAPRTRSDI
jgi:hypothetical protein